MSYSWRSVKAYPDFSSSYVTLLLDEANRYEYGEHFTNEELLERIAKSYGLEIELIRGLDVLHDLVLAGLLGRDKKNNFYRMKVPEKEVKFDSGPSLSSFFNLSITDSTITAEEVMSEAAQKVHTVEVTLEDRMNRISADIQEMCSEKVWTILSEIMDSPDFHSMYEQSQNKLGKDRLYSRHDRVHAITVTWHALKLTDLLFLSTRDKFALEDKVDLDGAKLVIGLAALWHDCGNSVDRHDHHLHSVELARPFVREAIQQYYESDEDIVTNLVNVCVEAIQYHTEDAGICNVMESAIVRVADGLDCTVHRCGESGRRPFLKLIEQGQVSHIYSKVGIDDMELGLCPETLDCVRMTAVLDPDHVPKLGPRLSICIVELEQRLIKNKIMKLGPELEKHFQLWCRVSGVQSEWSTEGIQIY